MKHIQNMKTTLKDFNAVAVEIGATMMMNRERFTPEYRDKADAPLKEALQEAANTCRAKLTAAHDEAVNSVQEWAKINSAMIDNADMMLLAGDFPLTAADFQRFPLSLSAI